MKSQSKWNMIWCFSALFRPSKRRKIVRKLLWYSKLSDSNIQRGSNVYSRIYLIWIASNYYYHHIIDMCEWIFEHCKYLDAPLLYRMSPIACSKFTSGILGAEIWYAEWIIPDSDPHRAPYEYRTDVYQYFIGNHIFVHHWTASVAIRCALPELIE